ncbi:hypothetical protein CK203_101829 [Vitis vinifera]|uniref:Uncharacterized protein n=1 Tax=Vitis vinifera TaxID=29760 RepID=A0A438ET04_VITVI|nr:hypothetical protein CK203_101829 [Vitis vinifera]
MMMKEMRFFFGMLKEALKIPFRNPNFVVFSFLTSLPLFTFMLINDFIIQQTLIQTAKILTQTLHPNKFFDFDETPLGLIERAIEEVSHNSSWVSFILESPMKEIRFKGPLITSIYTFILASFVFLALLIKSVEWSAIWNMSIVISVLEEKHGDVALVLSSYHSRGSRQFGSLFMLVFFVWSFALRGSCLYMGWSGGGNGIRITSAYVSLVCLGNTMKWLVFVVYLHNCKNQRLERVDPEVEEQLKLLKKDMIKAAALFNYRGEIK